MAGLRIGTASVVRILTTDPSVSATTCVKSGTDNTGTADVWALPTPPMAAQATNKLVEAYAMKRFILPFPRRSEEHTSELQSLMRISYAVFCLKKKIPTHTTPNPNHLIIIR